MSNSGLDLIVLLLDSIKNKEIVGKLRFHKLLFLLIKEGGFKIFEEEFSFEPYNFGPWSSKLDSHLQMLEDKDIIAIERENIHQPTLKKMLVYSDEQEDCLDNIIETFKLQKKGTFIAEKLKEKYRSNLTKFIRIIDSFSIVTNSNLLRYIYTAYPYYSNKSKIREEIQDMSPKEEFETAFPGIKIDDNLFSIVGIIPDIPLEEEKRRIREIIMERF